MRVFYDLFVTKTPNECLAWAIDSLHVLTMRKPLKRLFKYGSLAAILCLAYGFMIEPRLLFLREVSIESANWQGPDLRIALVSDVHIGGLHVDAKRASSIAQRLSDLNADMILMPGDFVNGHIAQAERSAEDIADIEAGFAALGNMRAHLGVYASLGNHDSWYGKGAVKASLGRGGVRVLTNGAHNLDGICIVGLADFDTDRPSRDAFNACAPSSAIIVLTHSPDALQLIPDDAALVVAGHTHGGQVNLPIIGRRVTSTRLGKPYAYGLVYDGERPIFITAGIGTSIMPARFRAPPEIVLITLKAKK
jgi:predicted MPP superfamily phosphohydrolase